LDIDPANRLGLRTVWVNPGTDSGRAPGETEPDAVIPHIRHIDDAIRALLADQTTGRSTGKTKR